MGGNGKKSKSRPSNGKGKQTTQKPATSSQQKQMVEEAAYFLAMKRSFEPGYELDDWLAAERQIGTFLEKHES